MQSTTGSRAFQSARLQKKFKKQAETLIAAAFAAFRDGRRTDAEALCRRILQDLPDHFEALRLLGVCALEDRRFEEAREVLERAAAANPRSAEVYVDLGTAHFELKHYDKARALQEKAIALKPTFPLALTNLGNTLFHMGLLGQALEYHDRAIELKPDYSDAYCNRGMVELTLGRYEEANRSFERALLFQPRHVEAIGGKGIVSLELRHYEEAEAAFAAALAIRPNAAKVLANRGRLNFQLFRLDQAAADFDAALALQPTLEVALRGKVQTCLLRGDLAQAIVASKRIVEQNPNSEVGWTLLGGCLASRGAAASAIEHFDRALAIRPDYEDAINRKIFTLDFLPEADFAVQQAARKYWWDNIGSKFPQRKLSPQSRDAQKRIVVGYVSSDFRRHSAGFAFLPVLRHHDHLNFEIICYSCFPREDEVTHLFRSLADRWVDAWQLSDDELADRIQADKVDILVDLSGHSLGHRLAVFSMKPAPVQVTAWGSGTGTGLATMDYMLADPVTVPDVARALFAERIFDLPSVITMEPVLDLPVAPSPILRNGYPTFGVFNRIDKISDDAIRLWATLMSEVSGSRIIIKHVLLDDALLRDSLVARFVAQGLTEDRISCLGTTSRLDHLLAFESVDISLDPFPQNGGISTFESLYMGVPVVAKLGNGASSRVAGGILKAIGLDDWVANDDEGYVAIARNFASAPAQLERLRTRLRNEITSSRAGNVETYTREVETAYRQFWRDYCASAACRSKTAS